MENLKIYEWTCVNKDCGVEGMTIITVNREVKHCPVCGETIKRVRQYEPEG